MRLFYSLIVLALIAASWWFFTNDQAVKSAQPAATTNIEDTSTPTDESSPSDYAEMDDMMNENIETGTDVNMEFPVPDLPDTPEMIVTDEDERVFDVVGTNFMFSMKEIRVREGETVTINFTAGEGFHDWAIDEFDSKTAQVRPGTPTSVTFVADKKGTFEYYCSVGNHRAQGMIGTLIVE
jgi:plastocyanin